MRTFSEILLALRTDFVNNTTLVSMYNLDAELTFEEQFSTVSLESVITYLVAYAIFLHEQIVSNEVATLMEKIGDEYYFSKQWYKKKILQFQLGDALVFNEDTNAFGYAEQTESKQIIKHVALRELTIDGVTQLQVFVAKENKEALEASELEAFKSYLKGIAAAGTHFNFVSLTPDSLALNLSIIYNPQVMYSTGLTISDGSETVKQAVVDYLNSITYSGKFCRSKLIDAVQQATGVLDARLGAVQLNGEINESPLFESPSGFFIAETDNISVTYQPGNVDDY